MKVSPAAMIIISRDEHRVKSNIVNKCVRTWYTHYSLEILRLISVPLVASTSAILKLR